jgi:GT2 family glycosyltransferase
MAYNVIKKALRLIYDLRSRKDLKFFPRTVSVYTLSLGRKFYLEKLLASMQKNMGLPYQHVILNQGVKDKDFVSFLDGVAKKHQHIKVIHAPENLGINQGCKKCVSQCSGDLIIKIDEDMKIISEDFLKHLLAVYNAIGEPVALTAFPAGFTGHPAGVMGRFGHSVYYSKETDTYYAIRWVHYLGGYCECIPKMVYEIAKPLDGFKGKKKSSGQDVYISRRMRKAGFRLGYFENACIVEHQDSTLGQEARLKEYFEKKKKS